MSDETIKLLLIEDDMVDRMAFERAVKTDDLPYDYTCVASVAEGRTAIKSVAFDVVISDYNLGDGTAFDVIEEIGPDVPVIMVTGAGDEEVAVKAMKAGASDYIIKDASGSYLKTLPITVSNTIKAKKTERRMERYHAELERLVEEQKKTNDKLAAEIAQRERTEEQLRESLEIRAGIVDTIPSGLLTFQYQPPGEFFLVDGNPEAERILGINLTEWRGQEIDEIWPNARREGIHKAFSTTIETGERFADDACVYQKAEVVRFFRVRAFCIPGELLGVAFEDVTDRTKAELALREAYEQLEMKVEERTATLTRQNEQLTEEIRKRRRAEALLIGASRLAAMAQMAGSIVETFQELLQVVTGRTEEALIALDSDDSVDIRPLLEEILTRAGRENQTIQHLLQFARARAGKYEWDSQHVFDLAGTAQRAVDVCKQAIEASEDGLGKDVSFILDLHEGCTVDGEENEMVDVLVNLVNNAVEAMPEGGNVMVRTFIEDDQSIVTVEDDGPGIPTPEMAKIFEPFWTTKPSHPGLGLTTSFGIVHRHGGTIRVTSQTGKGTKVRVRLCCVKYPEANESA